MPLTLSDLEGPIPINWEEVQNRFRNQPSDFENLLFKIHFERKNKSAGVLIENIQKILSYGYQVTNDIRYYNEFLWFHTATPLSNLLKTTCDSIFRKNLNPSGHHSHGFNESKFQLLLNENQEIDKSSNLKGKKIGLIGVPVFFGKIQKMLTQKGANVHQIFIPKHPSSFVNWLFQIKPLIKIISLVKGNPYPYQTVTPVKNPGLYDELQRAEFDIGFHKLNFIIRPNIFNAFRVGLINDHWGPLPYIRGKSTLAYSLLLGFPVTATTHLVEKGIDTGRIIRFYTYSSKGLQKIKNIKNKIKQDLPRRAADSIACLANGHFNLVDNQTSEGLTFYEIHPILYQYIENNILTQ